MSDISFSDATIEIGGQRLEYRRIGQWQAGAPVLVFLHEGLGCIEMWRDFPQQLCAACGLPGLVYSRQGYGRSAPWLGPRAPDFMHREALVVLPDLLAALDVERPLLIGHSDGASIALIYAGGYPHSVHAAVVMAPHLFIEPICVEAIVRTRQEFDTGDLRRRLARYHADVDGAFRGWADVWLSPAFLHWSIESEVAASRCPVLAIQGYGDQYGTMRQIERIAELRGDVRLLKLDDCRHSPHVDQGPVVLDAIRDFVTALL